MFYIHDFSENDGEVTVTYYCYPESVSFCFWIVPGTLYG